MNIEEMDQGTKFIYLAMTQSALALKDSGMRKKEFLVLASEIWDSMMMNDTEKLQKALLDHMESDIEKKLAEWKDLKEKK